MRAYGWREIEIDHLYAQLKDNFYTGTLIIAPTVTKNGFPMMIGI